MGGMIHPIWIVQFVEGLDMTVMEQSKKKVLGLDLQVGYSTSVTQLHSELKDCCGHNARHEHLSAKPMVSCRSSAGKE